jgi:hypothetical protein
MNKLFVLCLLISISGILTLYLISLQIKPIQVSSYSELKENEFVQVQGKIISDKYFPESDFSIIKLDNNIAIICNCQFPKNITIKAEGKVEEYNNQLQINAQKIEVK